MPRTSYTAPDSAQRSQVYAEQIVAAEAAIRSGEGLTSVAAAGTTVLGNDVGDVLVDPVAAGGAVVVQLPALTTWKRARITVKRTTGGGNTVTVTPPGGVQIDNLGAGVGIALAAINDRLQLMGGATTSQWWRVD